MGSSRRGMRCWAWRVRRNVRCRMRTKSAALKRSICAILPLMSPLQGLQSERRSGSNQRRKRLDREFCQEHLRGAGQLIFLYHFESARPALSLRAQLLEPMLTPDLDFALVFSG